MVGIYLSGTGNSKHCLEKFLFLLDDGAKAIPIENPSVIEEIKANQHIVFSYPTQFSNAPLMVRNFIKENKELWCGKEIFCINTMGAFSGDGTGCTARLFKKYGAKILGGLQIKMPDSVCDSKLLKKSQTQNEAIVKAADQKIAKAVKDIILGNYPREGLSFVAHIKGLFGQRLYYLSKTSHYSNKLKINDDCISCGLCVRDCPMDNLSLREGGKPIQKGNCTMCYRCISHCPQKAITLLGKKVIEQTVCEKYIN